jgi:hypothetical protein
VLSAELEPDDVGERLTLAIVWDEPQREAAPVRLVGWIAPPDDEPDAADDSTGPDAEATEP